MIFLFKGLFFAGSMLIFGGGGGRGNKTNQNIQGIQSERIYHLEKGRTLESSSSYSNILVADWVRNMYVFCMYVSSSQYMYVIILVPRRLSTKFFLDHFYV